MKIGPIKGVLFKGVFIPKLPKIVLASSSLINSDFLLLQTIQFDESLNLLFLFLQLLEFYFLHFFHTSSNLTVFYN